MAEPITSPESCHSRQTEGLIGCLFLNTIANVQIVIALHFLAPQADRTGASEAA